MDSFPIPAYTAAWQLALRRKPPVRIPLSSPDITEREREAVQAVLRTRHLALGPKLREFEEELAAYHDRRFAVAVNSGTSALHLAVLALGLAEGDDVLTTPFSFIASTNCILYAQGRPRFVDIDPATWNIDLGRLERALTQRTRGIIPVHVFGTPCGMPAIRSFARHHGLWVIEDACEAIGAQEAGGRVGKLAEISVLAFYPNKQITTGEGGVVLTDDPELAALCRSLRNQGRGEEGAWLTHERIGYNYRLSDIAAALGCAQLERIEELLEKRARVAARYHKHLSQSVGIQLQSIPAGAIKSWFVYVIALAEPATRAQRDAVLARLREAGIGCGDYFTPIHLQPFMRARFGFKPGDLPRCESLSDRTIALPFHANLKPAEVDEVCEVLLKAMNE